MGFAGRLRASPTAPASFFQPLLSRIATTMSGASTASGVSAIATGARSDMAWDVILNPAPPSRLSPAPSQHRSPSWRMVAAVGLCHV